MLHGGLTLSAILNRVMADHVTVPVPLRRPRMGCSAMITAGAVPVAMVRSQRATGKALPAEEPHPSPIMTSRPLSRVRGPLTMSVGRLVGLIAVSVPPAAPSAAHRIETAIGAALLQGRGLRRCHRAALDPRRWFVIVASAARAAHSTVPGTNTTIMNHPARRPTRIRTTTPIPRSAAPARRPTTTDPELPVTN